MALKVSNSYWGSIWAATEAISNYVAVGGDYRDASLIENFIWPFPDEESLWSLDKSVDAVCDFMKTLKIPVISGKDSLSSTYRSADGKVIKIPPVLCMSVFGKIPDVVKTTSSDFKKVDSTIVLLGKQDLEMGGSIYLDVNGQLGDKVPKVDLKVLPKVLTTLHKAIESGEILAAHDISEGGLITTIFEMCLGGNMGGDINVQDERLDYFLFNETAGCFVVEVENEEIAKKLFDGAPYIILGKTTGDLIFEGKTQHIINIMQNGAWVVSFGLEHLKEVWQKPMKEIFG